MVYDENRKRTLPPEGTSVRSWDAEHETVVNDDLYNRLKRLNKGHLAQQLVRGRELADRPPGTGQAPTPANEDRRPPSTPGPVRKPRGRKRLSEDMIAPVAAEGPETHQDPPRRSASAAGLGDLEGLRRLRPTVPSPATGTRSVSGAGPATGSSGDRESWQLLANEVSGEFRLIGSATCLVRSVALPAGTWFGSQPVPEADGVYPEALAQLARDHRFRSLAPSDLMFLDTETTGLAGGTGTVAFLVGMGVWREGEFWILQYFMPDFPEEPALLHLFEAALAEVAALVTYNGKAFDVPLLSSRLVRNRSQGVSRLADIPHLDLLHPARRLWKQRLGDCSLTNLEAGILGFQRERDIPGWEIPQVYFRFLTEGEIGELPTVFLHNQHDLLTLAHLLARACRLYHEPLGDRTLPGIDLYSLARSLELDGSPMVALEVLEEARLADLDAQTRRQLLRRLSLVYKRRKNWDAAVAIWQELGEWEGILEAFSFEEMAKFYEHVAGDLRLAAAVTTRILEALKGRAALDPSPYADLDEVEAAFAHRLRRIERRLSRSENREDTP